MLAHMTLENKYTYTIFLDNDLIYSEWGYKIFSFPMGQGFVKDN